MKSKKNYYVKYWLPPVVYCLFIFGQSMLSISTDWVRDLDKPIHFIVYMFLGMLIFRAFTTISRQTGMIFAIILSVTVSAVIGAADEFFQVFTPARTVDVSDIRFDLLGSITGIALFFCLKLVKKRRNRE